MPLEAVLELRGKPCSGDGRGNWGWAEVEGGGEMLFAEVIGLWWPVGGVLCCALARR